MRRHIGFGSTPNFDNLYGEVSRLTDPKGRFEYANYDPSLGVPPTEEQKQRLSEYKPKLPTLTFTGSEKLHGENMAVCYTNGHLWTQGRNHIRTILEDQNGMAQFVEKYKDQWVDIISQIKHLHKVDTESQTIVIDCEWAGENIQKGNAACSGATKGAYIFDYIRVANNDSDETSYKSTDGLLMPEGMPIYLMKNFSIYGVVLDFSNPQGCEEALKALALHIEENSSIAKYHNTPDNVGEGAYLWCTYDGHMLRLKTKGEKHGGKQKTPKEKTPLDDTYVTNMIRIADKVTPVWRITQAITELNATEKKMLGAVIKWVLTDVAKEETPTLIAEGVELANLSKFISNIVKDYYFDHIKAY